MRILLDKPERERFSEPIAIATPRRLMSAASLLEAAIVLKVRYGERGGRELDLLLLRARFEIFPVDAEQVEIARQAFRNTAREGIGPGSILGTA